MEVLSRFDVAVTHAEWPRDEGRSGEAVTQTKWTKDDVAPW